MEVRFYQIDAFVNRVFAGNPAGVCFLDSWIDDPVLQSIAAENNLSETAFLVRAGKHFELRWFTPKVEIDLCGHATLASAFAIFEYLEPEARRMEFRTKSGLLFWEYAESIIIALLIAFFVRTFIVQSFKIPSGSMEDTLAIGDYLLVSKFIYGIKIPVTGERILRIRDPKRGDVIVFQYPKDTSKDFIKRVIGIPGDVVEIRDKKVYVNGEPYENPHEVYRGKDILPGEQGPRDNLGPVKVPENSYFVMGDNRDNSYDSRFWGFVKVENIKGLAFIKYWSWDNGGFKVRWGNIGRMIT